MEFSGSDVNPEDRLDFQNCIELLNRLTPEQKERVFKAIRSDIIIHPYEKEINAPAESILEAVSRSSDLTKRGIRGILAEATFVLEVLPTLEEWVDETDSLPPGNHPFDAVLVKGTRRVRIQVKMQRQEKHKPKIAKAGYKGLPSDHYVVEVQRTRTGKRKKESEEEEDIELLKAQAAEAEGGTTENTRPYRFGEFDLLAVSMEASSKDWRQFMYLPADKLDPSPNDARCIRTFQYIPQTPSGFWCDNLQTCLDTYFAPEQ